MTPIWNSNCYLVEFFLLFGCLEICQKLNYGRKKRSFELIQAELSHIVNGTLWLLIGLEYVVKT